MTDRPSDRELLRRVVANDDAMRDGSHIEHLLPHFDERKAIIEAIRARLAEPEESCENCVALRADLDVMRSDRDYLAEQSAALRAENAQLQAIVKRTIADGMVTEMFTEPEE